MKNLKIVAIVALFAIATGVSAQDKMERPMKLQVNEHHNQDEDDDQIEKFKDQLNLTEEQKAQIKEIRGKRAAEKKELKTKLKDIRVAERVEINQILTEEQRALIKEKKQMKHEKFKGKKEFHREKMKQQ
jgi:Spy/CpxP family protein refolding chaperone